MPVRPKPPKPGAVDITTPGRTSRDSATHGIESPHLTPGPFIRKTPPDTSEPGSSKQQMELQLRRTACKSIRRRLPRVPPQPLQPPRWSVT